MRDHRFSVIAAGAQHLQSRHHRQGLAKTLVPHMSSNLVQPVVPAVYLHSQRQPERELAEAHFTFHLCREVLRPERDATGAVRAVNGQHRAQYRLPEQELEDGCRVAVGVARQRLRPGTLPSFMLWTMAPDGRPRSLRATSRSAAPAPGWLATVLPGPPSRSMKRVTNTPPGVWHALQPGSSISLPRIVLDGTAESALRGHRRKPTRHARPPLAGRSSA